MPTIFDLGQDFWEQKEANRKIYIYLFAPFLNEVSLLLLWSSRFWHPWGRQTKKMLLAMAGETENTAESMRKLGLSWSGLSETDSRVGYLLSAHAWDRYHGEKHEKVPPLPHIATFFAATALELLFALRPHFEKVEKTSWEESGKWVKSIDHIIEDLANSPLMKEPPSVDGKIVPMLARHAMFLECEGLAYMQAHIEGEYLKDRPQSKRKRVQPRMTDEEIRHLADDIGVDFAAVKEVMEEEHSSWWDASEHFSKQAKGALERAFPLFADESVRDILRAACDPGMASNWADDHYPSEQDVAACEKIVKCFIAMFLSFASSAERQRDGRELPKPLLALRR